MSLNATSLSHVSVRRKPHLPYSAVARRCAHNLGRCRHNMCTTMAAAAAAAAPGSCPVCATETLQRITNIDELMEKCQVVLLDQFGVLHDGKQPYPQAVAAVGRLAAAGKQILVLSNSSRRSGGTIGKLAKMGFDANWFAGAITSGELTHRYLAQRPDPWWQQLGRSCLHLTWSTRGNISLEGLDLEVVVDPSQADFILAHGTEALGLPDGSTGDASLEQLQQLLEQCVQQRQQQQQADGSSSRKSIPMIVANPDLVTVDGPALITMPGTLAHCYKQIGGDVLLMGKPSPIIYTAAQQMVQQLHSTSTSSSNSSTSIDSSSSSSSGGGGTSSDVSQWLAIGDSLEHDIAGAVAAGIRTLFIVGGIHAQDVQLQDCIGGSNDWSDAAMQQLCEQHGTTPDYCMAYLQ